MSATKLSQDSMMSLSAEELLRVGKLSSSSSLEDEGRGFEGKLIVRDDEEEGLGAEMRVEDGDDEDFVPIPAIHQLPFCDNNAKTSKASASASAPPSRGEDGIWGMKPNQSGGGGLGSGEDSDEIVLSRSSGLGSGQHILVATLDGKLALVDYTGKILWSFSTGHLFSSTISSLQVIQGNKLLKHHFSILDDNVPHSFNLG